MRGGDALTTSALALILALCGAGTRGDSDNHAKLEALLEDDFKQDLLERGLKSSIPVLVDNGVTSMRIFSKLEEEEFAAVPFKLGHRRELLHWWKSLTADSETVVRRKVRGKRHQKQQFEKVTQFSGKTAKTRSKEGYPSPTATQADWGDAKFSHCEQPFSWSELLHGYKNMNISTIFKMGGLGKLVEEDGYETWLCMNDHYCAVDAEDPWFCFVYHETQKVFTPWGENSRLNLVRGSVEKDHAILVRSGVSNAVPVIAIDDEHVSVQFLHYGKGNLTKFTIEIMKAIPSAEVLIIGGGGGGGGGRCANRGSGGGGAGGLMWIPSVNISKGTYEVIVGAGGKAGPGFCVTEDQGKNGHASSFLDHVALGGGGGGGGGPGGGNQNGLVGGSGGGGADHAGKGAAGMQTNVSSLYGYGNASADSVGLSHYLGGAGGGGGGAGGPGDSSEGYLWGAGGAGMVINITGSYTEYAKGGHGSSYDSDHHLITFSPKHG